MRPACGTNKSAIRAVQNVQAKLEFQHSIHHVGLHDLLRESFTLPTCHIIPEDVYVEDN